MGAESKLAAVDGLTRQEVLRVTPQTIARIAKEVGEKGEGEWNKGEHSLWVGGDRFSNGWDSWLRTVMAKRGKAEIHIYFQYDNTDTTLICKAEDFLARGRWVGKTEGMDECRRGYRDYYCEWGEDVKAKVLQSLLREYVLRKYSDRLQKHEPINF